MVASKRFTPEDREAIAQAVAEAEKKTSGEIVPVVATASDRYDRAEDLFGLLFAIVAVAAAWVAFQGFAPDPGAWQAEPEPRYSLPWILATFGVAGFAGMLLADRVPFIRRIFAGRWMMTPRVEAAAADAFTRFHVRRTKDSTGIVIYVSLFERMVCVEADRGIAEKVPASEWKSVCEGLVKAMKAGRHREGFVEAIRRCGELLSEHFPIQPDDVDELTNELRIID